MIVCGDCGAYYGSKVWHSNDKYRKTVYRCNQKYSGQKCGTPSVDEKRMKEMFVDAMNQVLINKEEVMGNIEQLLAIKAEKNYEDCIREAAVALEREEAAYRALIEQQKTSPQGFERNTKRRSGRQGRRTARRRSGMTRSVPRAGKGTGKPMK